MSAAAVRRIVSAALAGGLLLMAVPAAAENWREFPNAEPDAVMWVDLDTIRVVEGVTHFRIKLTLPNLPGYAVSENTADCAARTGETHAIALYDENGEQYGGEDYSPAETTAFDEGDAGLVAIICP